MLKKLEEGIYIPEYDITIPWLIEQSELKNYIPEENIFFNKCKCPYTLFTFLGIEGYYYFNFKDHFKNKLSGLSLHTHTDEKKKEQWHHYIQEKLELELGKQPNLEPFWSTKRFRIENRLRVKIRLDETETPEEDKSTSHYFTIRYFDSEDEQYRKGQLVINNKPFVNKAQSLLNHYKLSTPEYNILLTINGTGPFCFKKIESVTERFRKESRLGDFSLKQYKKASKNCLKKGLIEKLSQTQRYKDEKRFSHQNNQNLYALLYEVGDVDLTQKGYDLLNEINTYLYDLRPKENDWRAVYIETQDNMFSYLTTSKDNVIKTAKNINNNPDELLEKNQTLVKISQPYKISNWWFSRHKVLPHGWRIDISFTNQK